MCGFQDPLQVMISCKISLLPASSRVQSYANTPVDYSRDSYSIIIIYIIHQKYLKAKRKGACSF